MGEQRYMLSGRGWVHSLRIDGDELGYFLGVCMCVCVCVCGRVSFVDGGE